jgi:flagellar biosynthesis chaperone FliJ
VTEKAALATLERLRRRDRDEAERKQIAARSTRDALQRRRRGWRERLEAEATAGEDPAALPRWLEACRTRERALAAEAARLEGAVAAAEAAHRRARLALEQIEVVRERARTEGRRRALAHAQRRLDELAVGRSGRQRPFSAGGGPRP